jgi:hypothetical protein
MRNQSDPRTQRVHSLEYVSYASVKFGYACCEIGLSLEETLKKMKKVLGVSNG